MTVDHSHHSKHRKGVLDNVVENEDRLSAALRLSSSPHPRQGIFRNLAQHASIAVGRPWAFAAAAATILVWALVGPVFHYSDTWQLVINTGTTIITFLMVFLIQSAQNRDTEMMRLKLDAIILSIHNVSNAFIDLEKLNDDELEQLRQRLTAMAASGPRRTPK